MRAPDDMPRRPRRAPDARTGAHLARRRRRPPVLPDHLAARHRQLLHRLPLVRLARPVGRSGAGVLGAKIALAAIFTVAFFVIMWINLVIADRLAPPFRPAGPEDEVIERYHELVGGRVGARPRLGVGRCSPSSPARACRASGTRGSSSPTPRDFGIEDPQFNTDIGFYVFRLPFLTFLVGWLFAALLIVLIVTAVAHYLNGGIRMSSPRNRVTPQVKAHLSVLLGLLALVKAAGYWLQRFELTASTRGFVDGAGYTDVNAQLPAINLLLLIMVASFVLFIINIWRRGWTLPILGVGLWALDRRGRRRDLPAVRAAGPGGAERAGEGAARTSPGTSRPRTRGDGPRRRRGHPVRAGDGARGRRPGRQRRHDPQHPDLGPERHILGQTFQQLQAHPRLLRGQQRRRRPLRAQRRAHPGRAVRARPEHRRHPAESWAAEHLTYTHGYGAIVAPANEKETERRAGLRGRGHPVPRRRRRARAHPAGASTSARTSAATWSSGSKQREINFEDEDETKYTTYEGEDGVALDNVVKKAAFALRFGDVNPLISDQLTGNSRSSTSATSGSGCQALAPFLDLDADPYPVIHDGRIVWIVDAYTTTSPLPVRPAGRDRPAARGERARPHLQLRAQLREGGRRRLRRHRRLLRDAGRGSDHRRLPRRLPRRCSRTSTRCRRTCRRTCATRRTSSACRSNSWAKYHVTEADSFYQGNDFWDVALDPGTGVAARRRAGGGGTSTTTTTARTPRRRAVRTASIPTTCSPSSPARRRRSSCSCGRSCRSGRTTTASS